MNATFQFYPLVATSVGQWICTVVTSLTFAVTRLE
jgi:hypothetical protein